MWNPELLLQILFTHDCCRFFGSNFAELQAWIVVTDLKSHLQRELHIVGVEVLHEKDIAANEDIDGLWFIIFIESWNKFDYFFGTKTF
jgi:hypothetical protein